MTAGRLLLVIAGSSPLYGVADRFVSRWAELEPTQGLIFGLAGTPGRLSDWSPQGRARVAEALRQGLAELNRTPLLHGADRRAAAVTRATDSRSGWRRLRPTTGRCSWMPDSLAHRQWTGWR